MDSHKDKNIVFLGENLNLARIFNGMSCQDLGDIVNCSRQYINQLENGARKPNLEFMEALACALNVEVEFFSLTDMSMLPENQFNFRKGNK